MSRVTPAGVAAGVLRTVVAVGLAVDAWVHADLAPLYAGVHGSISEADLFRVEAGAASLAALLVLTVRNRWSQGIAGLVAASALGAVLLYRYVDVGALGPLPNMYEPAWFTEKTVSAFAEAAAALFSAAGLALTWRQRKVRRDRKEGNRGPLAVRTSIALAGRAGRRRGRPDRV